MVAPASLVGSHIAVGGGLMKVGMREAVDVGAEVIQVFTGNPRGWAPSRVDPRADELFHADSRERGIEVFVHAPHLINLGSPSAEIREKSSLALERTMWRAAALGASGVVVHAGSSVDPALRGVALGRLHEVVGRLLDAAPLGVRLLIEPTAGGGQALASTIVGTLEYLDAVDDERVAVCLDTCHLYAAGEDLAKPAVLKRAMKTLVDGIGRDRLGLVHVNDSCDPLGSRRDRHQSLGKGHIGLTALAALFTLRSIRGVPLLVETPTHADDVAHLKRLRAEARYSTSKSKTA